MLTGFEHITYDLNDYETTVLLPVFLQGFKKKVGYQNRITNREIVKHLKAKNYKVNDVRTRKIINHIRNNKLLPGLVAGGGGYYITTDPEEVKKYIKSLDGRENEIRRVKESMRDYLKQLLNGSQSNFFIADD
jgi:hypothetical protein